MNPSALRRALIEALGARCAICGRTTQWALTIDHVVPLANGGTDDISNLRVLCFGCNCYRRNGLVTDLGVLANANVRWGVEFEILVHPHGFVEMLP